METKFERRGDPQVTGIVSCVIESDKLSLYKQAAHNTGFELSVSARENQPHTFWLPRRFGKELKTGEELETVIIGKGFLGINITRPVGQKDHSAFWAEHRKLQATQNSPK